MARGRGSVAKDLKQADATSWKESVRMLSCLRCGGLMVAELGTDFWDEAVNLAVRRCVQCGELVDPIILQNRQRQLAGGLPGSRSRYVVPLLEGWS